jgi:aminopeptidase
MLRIEKSEIMNNRLEKLSETIVNYSLNVQAGETVLISCNEKCRPLVKRLIVDITKIGGIPFVDMMDDEINALLLEHTTDNRIPFIQARKQYDVDHYDCFIHIRYTQNEFNDKNVPSEIRQKIGKATEKIDDIRINERRWVLLNYPSHMDAFKARMTNDEFYNYALDVMNVDYQAMYEKIKPLEALMLKTDKVRLVAPNTDLTFSIKDIPVVPCCGKSNIPDGEIFTAPVRDSVNGTITYNTPCPYQGNIYTGVSLTFEDGKIVECHCNEDNEALKKIFDTDEGARYIGEFSLGLNPEIMDPMGDILYDEKIIGSIHFTPGRAYEEADNGNTSAIHWDMVLVMLENYGGGEIYFDDVLIRKDGLFVLDELKALNYNLK